MPRRLLRAGALLASLLALVLALVPAASAAAAEEGERGIDIRMHVGGFAIAVEGGESKGKQDMVLYLTRRHQIAEYVVPAEFTDSTVKAKFGALGELDYSFVPKGSARPECFSKLGGEAAFTGTFTFTGENGYIHIDADHADGYYTVEAEPPTCGAARADRAATTRRGVPYDPYTGDGATLTALAGSRASHRARVITVSREANAKTGEVSAFLEEGDSKLAILRGLALTAGGRAFEWDFDAGTATVRPPAPFTGSATLTRRADGKALFTGSLRVPILGQKRSAKMAGAEFRAKLHRGTPHDD
jgi:hypothetical protein